MEFDKRKGLNLPEFSRRLADISVYRDKRPLYRLLELLVDHSGIKIATLWKVMDDGKFACSVDRVGYEPDPVEDPTEFLCDVTGSHVELFLNRKPFETLEPWFIEDVGLLPKDYVFNTTARIERLGLNSAYMIPLPVDEEGYERYFLNIYFEDKNVQLADEANVIEAISLKTSAIVMSSFDQQKARISRRLQEVSRESVGEVEAFFEQVITRVLPMALTARRYFLFTKDDISRNNYWEYCNGDPPQNYSDEKVKEISGILTGLDLKNTLVTWNDADNRFKSIFGTYSSLIICPLISQIEQVDTAGFIVICDAFHKNSKEVSGVEIIKPFSKEQISQVEEIGDRCSSLFDIYLHEHRRQNMTNVLAHEILAPSIYIKSTASRLLRKARYLQPKDRRELENVLNTAGLQVSVCEGIFLSNQNRAHSFSDKYSPSSVPIHSAFVEWRKFLFPTCENYGLEFENIDINVVLPKIFVDIRALQVVFLNLCVNALKYSHDVSRDSGLFKLSVISKQLYNDEIKDQWSRLKSIRLPEGVKNDGFYILSFIDTGIGVPSVHDEDIFDEYFRVDNEAASFRSGMGLGLSMVRSIVRDHCGDVWLAKSGNPTVFRVALPMFLQFERDSKIAPMRKNR